MNKTKKWVVQLHPSTNFTILNPLFIYLPVYLPPTFTKPTDLPENIGIFPKPSIRLFSYSKYLQLLLVLRIVLQAHLLVAR